MMGIWSSTLFGSGGADPVAALAGDARVRDRRADAAHPRRPADDDRDRVDRPLLAGVDAALGPAHLRRAASTSPTRCGSRSRSRRPFSRSGCSGLVLAVDVRALLRNANSLSNLLEYPVWLVTGLLVALSLLPGWTRPISWVLAPTWGVRGIRQAAIGGDPLVPIAVCLGLGLDLPRDRPLHAPLLRAARARAGDAGAGMNSIRVFFIGGYLAYRALFNWIHWSIYIPTMLGGPIFQILFFAYIGRFAKLQLGRVLRHRERRRDLVPGRDLRHGDDDRGRALDADALLASSSRRRTGSRSSSAARCRTSRTGSSSRRSASSSAGCCSTSR